MGNFDLSPYIHGNSLESFGNPPNTAMTRGWSEYPEYPGYSRFDGGDGVAGYDIWKGKADGFATRWGCGNGGELLEQCHAQDCFFGCGGYHSASPTFSGTDYFDAAPVEVNFDQESAFGRSLYLDSDRLNGYNRYLFELLT
jgi:hypothetical protein